MRRKILILGDVHSSHLIKWIKALDKRDFEIHVFTLVQKKPGLDLGENIKVYYSGFSSRYKTYENEGSFKKLLFLLIIPTLLKLIREIKPDILHAHYASSYGLFGALTRFHPFFVSVWGSDIYSFPRRGKIHEKIIRFVLRKADLIFSTSRAMAKEINLYSSKHVSVIPFGIDIVQFQKKTVNSLFKEYDIVIGTIKNLEDFYGIDILIRIFGKLKFHNKDIPLKLLIVGSGAKEKELKELVTELKISDDVVFAGRVPYSDIAEYHNMISIFANLSVEESFGVSVLEASACEVPVIASDIGGLPEVVLNEETGFSISLSDELLILEKFQELIDRPERRTEMGRNGRKFVCDNYSWNGSVENMIKFYNKVQTG